MPCFGLFLLSFWVAWWLIQCRFSLILPFQYEHEIQSQGACPFRKSIREGLFYLVSVMIYNLIEDEADKFVRIFPVVDVLFPVSFPNASASDGEECMPSAAEL